MSTYLTIKKSLVDYIRIKDLKVGDKLPPETDLADRLNVSRLTLREALKVFREEGLTYTVHGIGTFLSSDFKQIDDTLDMNLGTTEMITSAGYKPGVTFFEKKLVKADINLVKSLNVSKGSDILVLKRVRTADNRPVIYSIDYFAPSLVNTFLSSNEENISIYECIEETLKIKIGNSMAEITPLCCTADLAKKLEYEEGKPVLVIQQIIYDQKGNPLVFSKEYFRPDCFKISINRRRIQR